MCPEFTVSTDQEGVVFQFPNSTKLESARKQMCKSNIKFKTCIKGLR